MKKIFALLLFVALFIDINAQQTTMSLNPEGKKYLKHYIDKQHRTIDKTDTKNISKQKADNRSIATKTDVSTPAPPYVNAPGQPVITPGHAKIILAAGDVWGTGRGYQMLIDADATAYGNIIPGTGSVFGYGDISASVYDQFEYKIPTNADGALSTSNIVLNDAVAIEIPAGVYDYCITNPGYDKMWIASGKFGRGDNFVFENGKVYIFTAVYNDGYDLITLSSAIAGVPSFVSDFTATHVEKTLSIDLSWTNPSYTADGDVLTELTSVVVERNGVVVHTLSSPVIGATETWTDNVPDEDNYEYSVYGVNSEGDGMPATTTIFAGNSILIGSVATVSSCGDTFTDDGGTNGNYTETTEENIVQLISFLPDEANKLVRATFIEFNTIEDSESDILFVINGNYSELKDVPEKDILDALYGDLTSVLPISYTSDSPDGALTFIFIRDSGDPYPMVSGWVADMDCVSPPDDDAGLIAVLSPASATSDSYFLSVNVKNFGSNVITSMDIKYEVNGTTVAETYTGNLGMFETDNFRFATPITFSDYGTADIKVYTNLSSDVNAANDTLEMTVFYRPAVKLYAYRIYGGENSFVSFESNEPHVVKTEKVYTDNGYSIRGGEYFNKELYAYTETTLGPKSFVKLSEDWNQISSVSTNLKPDDVAYDHSTGTMYAIKGSYLYTVDKFTGTFTMVASSLKADFMTLACDLSGQLYGTSTDGGFYSIDKTTGTTTLINQTGYTSAIIQSMAFDHNTGRLFWAYSDDAGFSSSLLEIDPVTGECANLGSLGSYLTEVIMLYTPYNNLAIPEVPVGFTVTPDADGEFSCELTWTNPALTTGGTALTDLSSIVIMRNSVVIHIIDNPTIGAATSWTDNTIPNDGKYAYSVYGINEAGVGGTSGQIVFVGCIKAINVYPLNVGFEEDTNLACWGQEKVSGSGTGWSITTGNFGYPFYAHSGDYIALFMNASSNPDVVKLITPRLDITDLSEPSLSFWHTQAAWSPISQDELRIYYKTSSTGQWVLLEEYTDDIQDWTKEIISLPNKSDDYYIAFEGTAKDGFGVVLDDISVYDSNTSDICNTVSGKPGFRVYPNPVTNGKLIVEGNFIQETGSRSVIRIYDLAGNAAGTFTATGNSITIDISHLPVGTYILKVNEKVAKIVKN